MTNYRLSEQKQPSFLFIMDRYETLNLETETSLLLMEELKARGVAVFWAELPDLVLRQHELAALAREVVSIAPFKLGHRTEHEANAFDAIVVRPDPPFDSNYLHLTYLLDFVSPSVKQFNRPEALRSLNEKLLPLKWPHLAPTTLTTQNVGALTAFLSEHKDIVVKPLDECSGRGIERVTLDTPDLETLLYEMTRSPGGGQRFVTAQAFLPDVSQGDKRVFLVAGDPVGMVNRVPAEGSYLGNIHQGAECLPADLSSVEAAAIAEIRPGLAESGVWLAGADFIGGKLTELNITSPSAIRQINEVSEKDIHPIIVDAMMAEIAMPQERLVSFTGNPSLGRGVGNSCMSIS